MFKKMSIRVKMLLGILPVLVAAMVLLTLISASRSKTIIINQVVDTANADLQANVNSVDSNLEQIRNTAENLARVVGASYKTTDMDTYGAMITDIISDNSSILGSGIWFEPNVYDSSQKYEGPYWTKDTSGNIAVTYDYSNADYDYFNQEYYTNAKAMTAPGAVITDPYYDQTSGKIMASCSAPIFDSSNTYVGCITVDMELTAIGNMVSGIKIGNTGTAMLTTSSGVYIYTSDQDKVTNAANITTDDPNGSFGNGCGSSCLYLSDDRNLLYFPDSLYYRCSAACQQHVKRTGQSKELRRISRKRRFHRKQSEIPEAG